MPLNLKSRYYPRRDCKQNHSRVEDISKYNPIDLSHILASFNFLLSWRAVRSMASGKEGERFGFTASVLLSRIKKNNKKNGFFLK